MRSAAALFAVALAATGPPGSDGGSGWRIAELRGIEVDGEISSLSPDGACSPVSVRSTRCACWDVER